MPDTKEMQEMSPAELKELLGDLRGEFTELRAADQRDDEKVKGLIRQVNDADTYLSIALNSDRVEALKFLSEVNVDPSAATQQVSKHSRSIGEHIVNAPDVRAWLESGMPKQTLSGGEFIIVRSDDSIDAGLGLAHRFESDETGGVRAIIGEFGTGGGGTSAANGASSLLPVPQPIAPVARQARLFMRDLIPVQPTTLSSALYVKELDPVSLEGGATAVPEGSVKPDAAIDLDPAIAYIATIAANISPTRQLWEDAPLVVAYINQRLPYLVKLREDTQIISGPGGAWQILGIKNQPNVQSQTAVSGETAQTLGLSIAKVENVDGTATAVVMNPTDAWNMFIKRAAGGSGTFDAGNPFAAGAFSTVWGLPVMRSRAYASGHALVGDFARGAMILDRQQVNTQVYPQHSDYAARNAILVQTEERVGLMVPRDDFFVNATIS